VLRRKFLAADESPVCGIAQQLQVTLLSLLIVGEMDFSWMVVRHSMCRAEIEVTAKGDYDKTDVETGVIAIPQR
jgi:hypothetical protein